MLLWLVLIARCSGSDEIPIDTAEQSSIYGGEGGEGSARARDGDLSTRSCTNLEEPAWLRVYFASSYRVEKVVVEKGGSYSTSCVFTVSVYDGEVQTVCGTYTGKPIYAYFNEAVQCRGKKGASVKIQQTNCVKNLDVFEMKVYGTALLAIGKRETHSTLVKKCALCPGMFWYKKMYVAALAIVMDGISLEINSQLK